MFEKKVEGRGCESVQVPLKPNREMFCVSVLKATTRQNGETIRAKANNTRVKRILKEYLIRSRNSHAKIVSIYSTKTPSRCPS